LGRRIEEQQRALSAEQTKVNGAFAQRSLLAAHGWLLSVKDSMTE
jgi:hypothetical protein